MSSVFIIILNFIKNKIRILKNKRYDFLCIKKENQNIKFWFSFSNYFNNYLRVLKRLTTASAISLLD